MTDKTIVVPVEQARETLWREWGIDGMPKDKQRLADAAFKAGLAAAPTPQQREMETAMGKVYRKDGKYLVRRESHTHTGFHERFEWADDVNDATVFYGDHGTRWRNLKEAAAGADALDATETRTVTITFNRQHPR